MKTIAKRSSCVLALAAILLLALCLSACGEKTPTTVLLGGEERQLDITELTLEAKDVSLTELAETVPQLPELRKIMLPDTDLTAQQIDEIRSLRSGLTVDYTVNIAGKSCGPETTALDLSSLTHEEIDEALEKLPLLPSVTAIELMDGSGETKLSAQEIKALAEALPGVELSYSIRLLDKNYSPDAVQVNLSGMAPEEMEEVLAILPMLPQLQEVELMDAQNESALSMADVKALMDALPEGAVVDYSFELFGQTVSTADTRVEYEFADIGNEGETQIRQALDILPNCEYFLLDDCGIDDEIMANIRADYPDTKVVWRVFVGKYNMLTDETVLRLTHGLLDEDVGPLQYVNDAVYLDLGHNGSDDGGLTNISFVQYMPKLECVILSQVHANDLSYFANCQNLEFLELCYSPFEDISVLANIPSLKYLNISFSWVKDISPLENLNLERLCMKGGKVPLAQKLEYIENHPDCLVTYKGDQPYGYGWRYDEDGSKYDYYANMREMFKYDDGQFYTGRKNGHNR